MFCIHRTQGKSNDMDNQQALLQQSWVFLFVCFTLFCFSFGVVFHLYLNTSSEKALYALYALDTCRLADHPFIVGNLLFITLNLDFHSLIQILIFEVTHNPSHSLMTDFLKYMLLVIMFLCVLCLIKMKYSDIQLHFLVLLGQ